MSAAWSPKPRDEAVGGLASLLLRADWCRSHREPELRQAVSGALSDPNAVVRMQAARAIRCVYADGTPERRVEAVGALLTNEGNSQVQTMLLVAMLPDLAAAPEAVDAVLAAYVPRISENDWESERHRTLQSILACLAMVHRTQHASSLVLSWCNAPAQHAKKLESFFAASRDYFGPLANPGRAEAFRLGGIAASMAAQTYSVYEDRIHSGATLLDREREELHNVVLVAHSLSQQIYHASGAFQVRQGEAPPASVSDIDAFARLAIPLMLECVVTHEAQTVSDCVSTLVYLGRAGHKRVLTSIAQAVRQSPAFAGDWAVSRDLIPYLRELLAEERALVLGEAEGVTAFREILEALAAGGGDEALALAYTFSDVFR